MELERISVAAESKGYVQQLCIAQRLLHAGRDRVRVVFGFNDGDRQVGLVVQDVIRPLCRAPADHLPPHDHPSLRERHLFSHLRVQIPSRSLQRRRDVLGADVAFAQGVLVYGHAVTDSRSRATDCPPKRASRLTRAYGNGPRAASKSRYCLPLAATAC